MDGTMNNKHLERPFYPFFNNIQCMALTYNLKGAPYFGY